MSLPKELKKLKNLEINCGLTTIKIDSERDIINIRHTGNIGNSIDDIKNNVDEHFGKGWFDKMEELATHAVEAGKPDYFYIRTMWFK